MLSSKGSTRICQSDELSRRAVRFSFPPDTEIASSTALHFTPNNSTYPIPPIQKSKPF